MKVKKSESKFYHAWTMDGEDWACEIEPISPKHAKACMNCARTAGVFFRDVSHNFNLKDRLKVRIDNSPSTQCWQCWIEGDGPFVEINRKGQTVYPLRYTIIFAKNFTELVQLMRRWKGGMRLNREVQTPWGTVLVVASEDDEKEQQTAKITCPNCKIDITLNVDAQR